MRMKFSSGRKCLFATILLCLFMSSQCATVTYDSRAIKLDGKRRLLLSGAIHYPRSTPEMWPDLIQKSKEGGLNAIETYVFWNAHEPRRREYNFDGNLNLIRFIKEIQNAGMYAILRIGPYVCAEWNYGALPVWLWEIPGMEYRTDNKPFKDEMQNFTTLIVEMVKRERLLAPQGGPIIITQIENEHGNFKDKYGDAGKRYIDWAARMADSLNIGVPWIMCMQDNAPYPMINTHNGFYGNEFKPNNASNPKMWTENWTGWFKKWHKPDEHRPTEDLAYAVARFFQSHGTLHNYYMYHGGTNFGRTTGGPYIVTSYDYDAPLDEYGNIRQPKWGHLKDLHTALYSMEDAILHGDYNWTDLGNLLSVTKFSGEGLTTACFLTNKNETFDATIEFEGNKYFIPAWSMSFLPDCKKEVYNTAKITAQTTIMAKKPNQAGQQPVELKWSWQSEALEEPLQALGGKFTEKRLLDQIRTTLDASDYLWYMTTFENGENQTEVKLRVNTTGHVLHAFVNGKLIGSQYSSAEPSFSFVFERSAQLQGGRNFISLLSATVGLQNYGHQYELGPAGIVDGPVTLIGNKTYDLSKMPWSYKVGLDGLNKRLYLHSENWKRGDKIPKMTPFTWYQTNFKAPLGSEPVVVDLLGMGKGEAFVNGQSIGRYWPSFIAKKDGCGKCDYRGRFKDGKCLSRCGQPSQRWYHIPRSFLKEGKTNVLTLFEEAGGDPSGVNFQTVVVGKVCGKVPREKTMVLSCQGHGRTIAAVDFASFGDPQGSCGSFKKGTCDTKDIVSVVENRCLGKESCSLEAKDDFFGTRSDCVGDFDKSLAVQATCSGA